MHHSGIIGAWGRMLYRLCRVSITSLQVYAAADEDIIRQRQCWHFVSCDVFHVGGIDIWRTTNIIRMMHHCEYIRHSGDGSGTWKGSRSGMCTLLRVFLLAAKIFWEEDVPCPQHHNFYCASEELSRTRYSYTCLNLLCVSLSVHHATLYRNEWTNCQGLMLGLQLSYTKYLSEISPFRLLQICKPFKCDFSDRWSLCDSLR